MDKTVGQKLVSLIGQPHKEEVLSELFAVMGQPAVLTLPAIEGQKCGNVNYHFGNLAVVLSNDSDLDMYMWLQIDLANFRHRLRFDLAHGDDPALVRNKMDCEPLAVHFEEDASANYIYVIPPLCISCFFDSDSKLAAVNFRIPPEYR